MRYCLSNWCFAVSSFPLIMLPFSLAFAKIYPLQGMSESIMHESVVAVSVGHRHIFVIPEKLYLYIFFQRRGESSSFSTKRNFRLYSRFELSAFNPAITLHRWTADGQHLELFERRKLFVIISCCWAKLKGKQWQNVLAFTRDVNSYRWVCVQPHLGNSSSRHSDWKKVSSGVRAHFD